MKHFFLIFLSLGICLATPLMSKEIVVSKEEGIKNFISWDKKLKTLQTDFIQKTSFEDTLISESFGRLYKQGNNIRLDTLENGVQVQKALTDKKLINIFDDKNKLITALFWEEWRETQVNKALFDFGNYAEVIKEHKVKDFKVQDNGYKLVLTSNPTEDGSFYTLEFLLREGDFFPIEILLSNEGVTSKTILKNIKINGDIHKETFK